MTKINKYEITFEDNGVEGSLVLEAYTAADATFQFSQNKNYPNAGILSVVPFNINEDSNKGKDLLTEV